MPTRTGKITKLPATNANTEYSYIWILENFMTGSWSESFNKKYAYKSDPIFIGLNDKYQWTLYLYVNINPELLDCLCIDLCLKDKDLHKNAKFTVEVYLLDKDDRKYFAREATLTHENINGPDNLFNSVVYTDDLYDNSKLFLDDGLKIACKICIIEPNISNESEVLQPTQETSSTILEKLWEDKQFSDIKLAIGKKEFSVHRAILAAISPVFRALFESKMFEAKEGKVDIEDVDPEIMEKTLHFIYEKKSNDIDNFIDKILVVAGKYQFDSLKQYCENVLVKQLTVDNVYDTLLLADQNNAEKLKKQAIDFFIKNAKELLDKSVDVKKRISSLPTNLRTEIIFTFMGEESIE